jgi:hypothetical protein
VRGGGDIVLEYADPGITLLTRANISVCLLRAPLTLERLQELRRASARVHKRLGFERVNLSVIEPPAMLDIPDDVRTASAALIRDFPALEVTVLEGGGFRSAAARAILNGIAILSAGRRRRIFDTVMAAAQWLVAQHHMREMTESELVILVDHARATLRAG